MSKGVYILVLTFLLLYACDAKNSITGLQTAELAVEEVEVLREVHAEISQVTTNETNLTETLNESSNETTTNPATNETSLNETNSNQTNTINETTSETQNTTTQDTTNSQPSVESSPSSTISRESSISSESTISGSRSTFADISACGTISSSSVLVQNVTATGTCMTIDTNDVTLDCWGNYISFESSGTGGSMGVQAVGITGITIKNCIINDSSPNAGWLTSGINFTNVNSSVITNNTIYVNSTANFSNINTGIRVIASSGASSAGSANNSIYDNTVIVNGSGASPGQIYGVLLVGADNNIYGNTIRVNGSNTNVGIFLGTGGNDNIIENNTVVLSATGTSGNSGIYLNGQSGSLGANRNRVISNNITANSSGAVAVLLANPARKNVIRDNIIAANGSGTQYGVYLNTGTDNTSIYGNTIRAAGTTAPFSDVVGLGIYSSSSQNNNLTIANNTIYANGTSGNYGIDLTGQASGSNITGNNITTDGTGATNPGVRVQVSQHITISNNRIFTNGTTTNYGIYLADGTYRMNNTIVSNNTIQTNGTSQNRGIVLTSTVENSTIFDNDVRTTGTSSNIGILVERSRNITVRNNQVMTNGSATANYGIDIGSSGSAANDVMVYGNNVTTGGTSSNYGLLVDAAANTTFWNNTVRTYGSTGGSNYGLYTTAAARGIVFIGNNITTNGTTTSGSSRNHGILIENTAGNNTIENGTIVTSNSNTSRPGSHGLYLSTTAAAVVNLSNSTFRNLTIIVDLNQSHGIYITTSTQTVHNNTFDNITLKVTGTNGAGIAFEATRDNNFNNINMSNATEWVDSMRSTANNNFTNLSLITPNGNLRFNTTFTIDGTFNITQTRVNITNNTARVDSQNLTFLNTSAQISLFGITTEDPRALKDPEDDGTFNVCGSNCTEIGFVGNVFDFWVTNFTTYSSNESAITCSTISETTTLTSQLNATTGCITITGNSITFDCNGRVINWNSAGGNGDPAIMVANRTGVTIQNCILNDTSLGGARATGINFTSTNDSVITNVTIHVNGTSDNTGIALSAGSYGNVVRNVNITSNGTEGVNIGFYVSRSSNNTIYGTIVRTNGTSSNYGVYILAASENNTLDNNTVITNGTTSSNIGVMIDGASHNVLIRNNISTNGTGSNHGFFIHSSARNDSLHDNRINSNGTSTTEATYGIRLSTVTGIRIAGNTINSDGIWDTTGIRFDDTGIDNITITNNTIRANGTTNQISGIYMTSTDKQANITQNNITVNSNGDNVYGLRIGPTNDNLLVNGNRITLANEGGVEVISFADDVTNATIQNNTLIIDSAVTGYIVRSQSTVQHSIVASNEMNTSGTRATDGIGFRLDYSSNLTIRDNNITANGTTRGEAIQLNTNGNNANLKVYGNRIIADGAGAGNRGIYIATNSGTFSNNTIFTYGDSTSNVGIFLTQFAQGNVFTGNNITTNGTTQNHGVYVVNSANNTFANGSIATGGTGASTKTEHGIFVNSAAATSNVSNGNVFDNVTITIITDESHAISLYSNATNNTFNNITLLVNGSKSFGVVMTGASDNIFTNVNFSRATEWIDSVNAGQTNNFTNTTFVTGNGSVFYNGTFSISGAANVSQGITRVNITYWNATVNSSALTFLNTTAHIRLNGVTTTDPQAIVDLEDDGTYTTCASGICTEHSFADNVFSFNVTSFTTYSTNETFGCQAITANTVMPANVSATTGCFTMTTNNTYLDCNGYTITWNTAGGNNDNAILIANATGVTVRNCVLRDTSLGGAFGVGINLTNATDGLFYNNSIQTNGSNDNYGITLNQLSNGNLIANSTIRTNGTGNTNYAIYGLGNSNNTITNSIISTNGTVSASNNNFGVYISQGRNYNITHNNITTNGNNTNIGMDVEATNGTLINNNTINATGTQISNIGLFLEMSSRNNTIRNNTIITNGTQNNYGMHLSEAYSNSLFANNITARGATASSGVVVETSENNTLFNNTILTNGTIDGNGGSAGISLLDARNNTFENETITTTGPDTYAVNISTSSDNNFTRTSLNYTRNWIATYAGTANNFTNTTFSTPNGSIRFNGTITIQDVQEINQTRLNITNNRAYVNTSNLTMLNTTAQIILNVTNLVDPRPQFANDDDTTYSNCTNPRCVEQSYASGRFTFNVTRFTAYRAEEQGEAVSINKTDSADPVTAGGQFIYTITVNLSDGNLTNATVVDTLPSQVTFVSSEPDPVDGSNNANYSLGNVTNGTVTTVNITVTASTVGTATNNATLFYLNTSNATNNVSVEETTTINAAAGGGGQGGGGGAGAGASSSTSTASAATAAATATTATATSTQTATSTSTQSMTSTSTTTSLGIGESVSFSISKAQATVGQAVQAPLTEEHSITVVSLAPGVATLHVQSHLQIVTIKSGETKFINLDDEGTPLYDPEPEIRIDAGKITEEKADIQVTIIDDDQKKETTIGKAIIDTANKIIIPIKTFSVKDDLATAFLSLVVLGLIGLMVYNMVTNRIKPQLPQAPQHESLPPAPGPHTKKAPLPAPPMPTRTKRSSRKI